MIDDQGEVAIIFEDDGEGGCKVQSFALPMDGKFSEKEKRNLYLSEYIKHENKNITDKAAKVWKCATHATSLFLQLPMCFQFIATFILFFILGDKELSRLLFDNAEG